ncbi:MAG: TIGR03663 family protein [Candidatus Aenigmatarchaeota archaeon]
MDKGSKFCIAFATILILAAGLRLYSLDERFYNWDEGLHVWYVQSFLETGAHKYDPVYHGPFPVFFTAPFLALGGFSEVTFRLVPAIFGIALVGLALYLRMIWSDKGEITAIVAAFFLAVSPFFLWFSRFYRNDIHAVFFSLFAFISLMLYFRTKRDRWLFGAFAALSLGFADMENTLITIFIFATFLLIWHFLPQIRARKLNLSAPVIVLKSAMLLAVVLTFSHAALMSNLHPAAKLLCFSIVLMLSARMAYRHFSKPVASLFAAGVIAIWIYATLFSSFFALQTPIYEPVVKAITTWTSRGIAGPPHYYLFRMALYELPVLAFGIAGIAYYLRRRKRSFETAFLIYWFAAALAIYSLFVGEKQPQVTMHMLLPLLVIASLFISDVFAQKNFPGRKIIAVALIPLMLFYLYTTFGLNYVRFNDVREPMEYVQIPQDVRGLMQEVVSRLESGERIAFLEGKSINYGTQPFYIFMRHYKSNVSSLLTDEQLAIADPEAIKNLTADIANNYSTENWRVWYYYPHEARMAENLANWRFWLFREINESHISEQHKFVVLRRIG